MRHPVLFITVLAVLGAVGISPVHAHGGPYRDSYKLDPLENRDPKDPRPPPEDPSVPPPPGAPDSPPPRPWPDYDNVPPARPSSPGDAARRRPISFENWRFWWRNNRDDILNLKDVGALAGPRIDRHIVDDAIGTALRRVIANEALPVDLRSAALIALARARPRNLSPEVFLRHCTPAGEEPTVLRQSAILGLSISDCRGKAVRNRLLALTLKRAGERDLPLRERAFAILALGFLRDESPEVWKALTGELDGSNVWLDIPVSVFVAIGLIGDEDRVPELLEWLESGRIGRFRLSDLERCWVVAALGRIGDPRVTGAITRQFRQKSRYAKRSAAIAPGRLVPGLGPVDQREQVRFIGKVLELDGDTTTRNFATMSLGRIAADARTFPPVRAASIAFLTRVFREGNRTTERPFAALALGLAGRAEIASRQAIADLIRPDLANRRGDPDTLGALAVALGLLGDAESFDLLQRLLDKPTVDVRLRRRAALALGLIGDTRAIPSVLAALREARDRDFVIDAATAAHLLGTDKAVAYLVGVIAERRNTQHRVASAIAALAVGGDRRAVGPLLAIVEAGATDGSYPDLTRAAAITALGRMADPRRHPVLFRLSRDVNYRASVPSLDAVLNLR